MYFVIGIIKGIILGCTAIIPGISIGTMALVLQVYEQAILYFSLIAEPKKWNRETFIHMAIFFAPLLIGISISMVLLATLISWLLQNYLTFVHITFLGIIIGSIPHIYKTHIKQHISFKSLYLIIIGIGVVLYFAFSRTTHNTETITSYNSLDITIPSILSAFLYGVIGSAFGLIPGISGSFVLLILGAYTIYLEIIKTLTIVLVISVLLGHIAGFILAAVVLKNLLIKYPTQCYNVILGMIIGSAIGIFPRTMFEELLRIHSPVGIIMYFFILGICFTCGAFLSLLSARLPT